MYAKLSTLVIACLFAITSQAEIKGDKHPSFYDSLYSDRLNSLPTEIDLKYNEVVRRYIDQYTKKGKQQTGAWLGKSKYYFPLFEEVLDKEGVPTELKYLPVIESALNPTARSRAGATGLWQFMHRTGTNYGLEINSLVDERCDPVKSTYAAVKYLKELYYLYQDWYLVIAAYNCGPANVNKAIYRSGGKTDYWDIYEYLPNETRNYIPAFIAATYVMSYHNEHEITSHGLSYPLTMDSIKISKRLHFSHISKALDVPMEEIRRYNPQYKKDIIPGGKQYTLNLPAHKILAFVNDEDAVYSGRKVKENIGLPEVLAQNSESQGNNLKAGTHLKIQEIEYFAIEPQLEKPELLVVSLDTKIEKDVLSNYLSQINGELDIQKLQAYNRTSDDMRLMAIVNNIDYRTNQYLLPVKKKSVFDQFIHFANATYSSVKGWGESQLDKIKRTKQQPSEVLFTENKTETSNVVVEGLPIREAEDIFQHSAVQPMTWTYNNHTYSLASHEDKGDILLYSKIYNKAIFENSSTKKIYHKVKIGETINKIASQYKVSKDDIILWNNLITGMAKISQRLLIYLPENDQLVEYPL